MEDLTLHLERSAEAAWEFQDASLKPLWGWIAGIIDGEGAIGIAFQAKSSHQRPNHRLYVSVGMTDQETVLKLKEITNVGTVKKLYRGPHSRPEYRWRCYSNEAASVLRLCLLWLVTKKKRALLALAFQEIMHLTAGPPGSHSPGIAPSAFARRQAMFEAMKLLNQRGVP